MKFLCCQLNSVRNEGGGGEPFPSRAAAAFLSRRECGGRGAEGRAAPQPSSPGAARRRLSAAPPAGPGPGRGGGRAASPAARKERTVSACPVTAVQPEPPPRRCPPQPGAGEGSRHGGGRPRHPAGTAGGAAQVGGSLPSAPAPQREATSGARRRLCRGGRSAGGEGRWEDRWDGLSPCPRCQGLRGFWLAILRLHTKSVTLGCCAAPGAAVLPHGPGPTSICPPASGPGLAERPGGRLLLTGPSCASTEARSLRPGRPRRLSHSAAVAGGGIVHSSFLLTFFFFFNFSRILEILLILSSFWL